MPVDPTSFKARFPEFAAADDARVQIFIDDAIVILNEAYWDTKYDLGIAYLAAHYLAIGNSSAAGSTAPKNPVSARSVDGVSVTFSTPTIDDGSDAYYGSTQYGQRYLTLRKTLGVPAFAI